MAELPVSLPRWRSPCLFVGGPADGTWHDVPDELETIEVDTSVPETRERSVLRSVYRACVFRGSRSSKRVFYPVLAATHEDAPYYVLRRLVRGYKAHAP